MKTRMAFKSLGKRRQLAGNLRQLGGNQINNTHGAPIPTGWQPAGAGKLHALPKTERARHAPDLRR
jgi:hypothetical protein